MIFNLWIDSAFTKEGHKNQTEHVKGGETGSYCTCTPQYEIEIAMEGVRKCLPEDFILREKAGEGENTCYSKGRDKEGNKRDRHDLSQSTHVAHILRVIMKVTFMQGMMHGVND